MKRLFALVLFPVVALAQEAPNPPPQGEADSAGPASVETVPVKPLEESDAADVPKDAVQLDTIQVTAEKRVKAQRDIPGSVGALRGADLEAMRAQGMKDYLKLVPGVVYSDQGNEESVPIIRGIATSIGFGATGTPVGIYLEDMPFADLFAPSSIPDLNPFDLERVEVLKGPQGTLFGSGALAGAIRYIVRKPDHGVWEAKVQETISRTRFSEGLSPTTAVAANVPVFDSAGLRGALVQRKDAGIYDEYAFDQNGNAIRADIDADRQKQQSWRVLGDWQALDDLKLAAFWFSQTTHNDDIGYADPAAGGRPQSVHFPFPNPRDHDFGGGNVTVTWDLPWAQLLSSTNRMTKHSWQDTHTEFGTLTDNQNATEFSNVFRQDIRGYTQELRLSSASGSALEWLVGGSYLHYGNRGFQDSYTGPTHEDPTDESQVSDADKAQAQVFATNDQVAYETAAFGEATARLGRHFEVTAGARKYQTKLRADGTICGAQIIALFQTLCHADHFDDKATGLNPKFSLRYIHDANIQAYVLAAKGFQFGGVQVNPPAPGFPESAQQAGYSFGPYKSSKLWNYEMGLRTEWLDRRVRFDTTFFYLDWRDLQLTIAVPLTGTNVPFNLIANVGRAHSEGVESSLDVVPFEGGRVTSSVTFMTAVTDELFDQNASDGGVKPGTRLPGAPRFQWSTVMSYEHSVPYFTSWLLGPALTYAYVGESSDQIRPTTSIGGYATLDARVALTRPSSRYQPELSFGVNNLTDVRGVSYGIGGGNLVNGDPFLFQHYTTPRTMVLSASLKY